MGYCSALGRDPEMGSRQAGAGCAQGVCAWPGGCEQLQARQRSSTRDSAAARATARATAQQHARRSPSARATRFLGPQVATSSLCRDMAGARAGTKLVLG